MATTPHDNSIDREPPARITLTLEAADREALRSAYDDTRADVDFPTFVFNNTRHVGAGVRTVEEDRLEDTHPGRDPGDTVLDATAVLTATGRLSVVIDAGEPGVDADRVRTAADSLTVEIVEE